MNRKFSIEAELQFVTAFGNSIMAEVSPNIDVTGQCLRRIDAKLNRSPGSRQYTKAGKRATSSAASLMS